MTITLLTGDCRTVLPTLAANSVHMVCTSPPYYALRSYLDASHPDKHRELGSEATPDEYLAAMVGVFREVRRVLRHDGTCWVNMGDSYSSGSGDNGGHKGLAAAKERCDGKPRNAANDSRMNGGVASVKRPILGIAPKQLLLMPARLALALQADGWWVRSAIVWAKPNPMPESAKDRPTSAYEMVYLLTKSAKYYYDANAIAEAVQTVPRTQARNGVLSSQDRQASGRMPRVRNSEGDYVSPNSSGASNAPRGEYQRSRQGETGSLAGNGQRNRSEVSASCSPACPESRSDLHVDASRLESNQGSGGASLPLLQTQNGKTSDGSCDPTEPRGSSRSIEHRAGLQELQQQERHQGYNAPIRNARNVWEIATHAFPEAHFATYPPELVERCIKAGTSERGCCAACGAPWVRVTERETVRDKRDRLGLSMDLTPGEVARQGVGLQAIGGGNSHDGNRSPTVTTTGWRASCQCYEIPAPGHDTSVSQGHSEPRNAREQGDDAAAVNSLVPAFGEPSPVPCTVLDPFLGSGTTALVADRLQRHCIGIDLSLTYADMAQRRIEQDCPLFTSWAPAEPPEDERMRDLFAEAAE
jgi:DNA modification methylase